MGTSGTGSQHAFGGSVHSTRFVTASQKKPRKIIKKSVRFCNYLIVGGEEEERNLVQKRSSVYLSGLSPDADAFLMPLQ